MWQLNIGRTCFCEVPHSAGMLGHQVDQYTTFSTTLRVRDIVMTSHEACTSRTSRVLTVASLQRLKMEALIPAPDNCEVQYIRKFLNAQSIAPIEIHRQLCRIYGHTRLNGLHISCRSFAGRCLIIIHPIVCTSRAVIWWSNKLSRSGLVLCLVSWSLYMVRGVQLCLDADGRHFQHMLWGISQNYWFKSYESLNEFSFTWNALYIKLNLMNTLGVSSQWK